MRLGFFVHGLPGHIDVRVEAVRAPCELGAWPGSIDLPACEATVTYAGRGYLGLLGWVQTVRSTDNRSGGSEFEPDPLDILGDVRHPFCFFGFRPTLFDAPSRDARADLAWTARSFLTVIGDRQRREVWALAGFGWGFVVADGQVSLTAPTTLDSTAWNDQLPTMTAAYPEWTFATDLRS
jgi:hypothetical protein